MIYVFEGCQSLRRALETETLSIKWRRYKMRKNRRWWGFHSVMILVLGSTGCVTQGSYNEMLADRDALSSQVESLEIANAESEMELVALRTRRDELEEALREEVVAGEILITEMRDGIRVDFSNGILFASGSAILSDKGRDVILRLAKKLRDSSETISVEGHTDNLMIGAALESQYPSNWELAGARAARVVRRLSAEGIDPTRLRAVSYGPFAPAGSNDSEDGRARNRRTEILLRPTMP
jgi:chemotaxis protein MotB